MRTPARRDMLAPAPARPAGDSPRAWPGREAVRIDDLDKRIIVALEADGRRPYRDIARDLGIAEATVRARVGRLTEAGLIRITAVGDPLSLGVSTAAITLIRTRPGTVHQVAETLAQLPNVRFVGVSLGSADVVIQTLHRDIRALHDFVSVRLPQLAPDIVSTETLQLADVLKSSWEWRAWFAEAEGEPAVGSRRAASTQRKRRRRT